MDGFSHSRHLRKVLRASRIEQGISMREVAEKIAQITGEPELSRGTIHNYETFKRHPRIDLMAAWARAVGLRLIVELDGAESDRVNVFVSRDSAATVYLVDALTAEDRATVHAIAEHLSLK